MKIPADVQPGDILAVDTGDSWSNTAIRAGQWLIDWRKKKPKLPPPAWPQVNHVIMVSDVTPRLLGIEGRPSGVGYVDLTDREYRHLSVDSWVDKADDERTACVEWARGVAFGKEYDWDAIATIGLDALGVHTVLEDLGIPALWREDWDGKGIPGQVICSTAWVWIRDELGMDRPADGEGGRYITPLDWHQFNQGGQR